MDLICHGFDNFAGRVTMALAKSPCALAEAREWEALQASIEANEAHACDRDVMGNLPLHLACRDPHVPLSLLSLLLGAFPGACQVENHAGLIPLQLAVAHGLPETHRNLLMSKQEDSRPSMTKQDIQRALLAGQSSFHEDTENEADHLPELLEQLHALQKAMKAQTKIYAHLRKHNWAASVSPPSAPTPSRDSRERYVVKWKQGDVGIRFYNSSMGCRVEKLSQGHGITTGIMNCRLGDVLVSINGQNVERLSVRGVMEMLMSLRKPVDLAFQPDEATAALDSERRADDEEASAWCHSQHEIHDQVLLLIQDTIARCESS
ncbi:hypothetical protein LEN26_019908 [Aphanomyces euteiches]|nr:hypothetical protein LEN26_019908 [Aphanomyces euteiches]KAH9106851.1 hypothetical protein AeMF1_017630 [Aphanomyces euteiches]KAH9131325.1 hypothetical protein AeNC1_019715 [Aphanomyces euteiches]